jgi:hypothetical protein
MASRGTHSLVQHMKKAAFHWLLTTRSPLLRMLDRGYPPGQVYVALPHRPPQHPLPEPHPDAYPLLPPAPQLYYRNNFIDVVHRSLAAMATRLPSVIHA